MIFREKCERFAKVFSRLPVRQTFILDPFMDSFDVVLNDRILHQLRVYRDAMDHRCRYFFRCHRCAESRQEEYRPCSDLCVWTERAFLHGEEGSTSHTLSLRGYGGKNDRALISSSACFGEEVDEGYFQDCTVFEDMWEATLR